MSMFPIVKVHISVHNPHAAWIDYRRMYRKRYNSSQNMLSLFDFTNLICQGASVCVAGICFDAYIIEELSFTECQLN